MEHFEYCDFEIESGLGCGREYPVAMLTRARRAEGWLVRQCAWCQRLVGRGGRYQGTPRPLLPDATHGICSACSDAMLGELTVRQSTGRR